MENSPEQQEILLEFVAESRDHLDNAEPMLIDIGTSIIPQDVESAVGTIFRLFHSLRGFPDIPDAQPFNEDDSKIESRRFLVKPSML